MISEDGLVGRRAEVQGVGVVEASFDVFLGHASIDKAAGVREFADRLKESNLRVFVDERAIDDYGSITRKVVQALEGSLAFVAWYSTVYPTRRACQLEMRAAYVAAESAREVGERSQPRARVLAHPSTHVAGPVISQESLLRCGADLRPCDVAFHRLALAHRPARAAVGAGYQEAAQSLRPWPKRPLADGGLQRIA